MSRWMIIATIAAGALLAGSCNKKKQDKKITSTSSVDDITGIYTGINHHRYRNVTSAGTHEDSTIVADTFIVIKVLPDSFIISQPDWDIAHPAFLYMDTTRQFRTRGSAAFNDHLDELTIRFNTAHDSAYIQKHSVTVSSNLFEEWDDFSGKK